MLLGDGQQKRVGRIALSRCHEMQLQIDHEREMHATLSIMLVGDTAFPTRSALPHGLSI